MTDRQVLHVVLLLTLADQFGELLGGVVADMRHRPAEVVQDRERERHRQFLAEVRAKLEERR